jgi:hypothetical protein
MDTHILDYTDVQLEVEVAGPEPSTSAAPPPPSAAAPHMLAPALTSNNHLSSLLLKDPTLQVQHSVHYVSYFVFYSITFSSSTLKIYTPSLVQWKFLIPLHQLFHC